MYVKYGLECPFSRMLIQSTLFVEPQKTFPKGIKVVIALKTIKNVTKRSMFSVNKDMFATVKDTITIM